MVFSESFKVIEITFTCNTVTTNTNLIFIAGGTILIGIILLISAILLFTLVSVVREKH